MVNDGFGRVITAMISPLKEDGSVNYAIAERFAAHLVEQGSDGILVCGTTGESPTLTHDEEFELFRVVRAAVGTRAKVIAGTGSNCTDTAIASTREAEKIGIDGTLQVVPYYNKPPQAGLQRHFTAIAQACPDLPVMLYNIPGRSGTGLQVETIAKLAEIDNILALKEASGSVSFASKVRANTPDSFALYCGEDDLTLPLLSIGATGVVSVASHLVSSPLQEMIQSFQAGNPARALEIHLKLLPLFEVLFCTTNPIPVKAALKLQGWEVGSLRSPLCEMPPELEARLKQVLQQLDLL